MLVEYVKDNYYARFLDPMYHRYRERHLSILLDVKFLQSMEREILVKGTGSRCVLEEYVKDNYYARLNDPSLHGYRERYFSILLDVKFGQSQWSVKCRTRVPGQGACL